MRLGSFFKLSIAGGSGPFVGGFAGGLVGVKDGVSRGGGSLSPNGERRRSVAGSLLPGVLDELPGELAPELGNCADRNALSAPSRFTTMLRVGDSELVPLFSFGDSSSNAVSRTELSTRIEDDGVEGRVNRNGFPDDAYPFVLSDVEVELPSMPDGDDCVDRAEASARSLRHLSSEAAFALAAHIATASTAIQHPTSNIQHRDAGCRLLTLDS
jgi:hypothetical protein